MNKKTKQGLYTVAVDINMFTDWGFQQAVTIASSEEEAINKCIDKFTNVPKEHKYYKAELIEDGIYYTCQ